MKRHTFYFKFACAAVCCISQLAVAVGADNIAGVWTTTADKSMLLEHRPNALSAIDSSVSAADSQTITLDNTTSYQEMVGFGATLTDGSAWVINSKLDEQQRARLLDELFTREESGIGLDVLRISLGASDLSAEPYTYADSETADADLSLFNFERALKNLVPLLKEIRNRNPNLVLIASPWSAPIWMKDNKSFKGGRLLPEYYAAYAQYFVKYLTAMNNAGTPVQYVTIQNEPENEHNNPSMLMSADEQATFIAEHLGPALTKAKLATRIMIFDHNCDHPEYPITVLSNAKAASFIDGSAFHLYAGDIAAMSQVKEAFPDKHIYFTEQWTSSNGQFAGDLEWHAKNILIGATNNWARVVLEWNLAADENEDPHTEGGCDACLGALTIDEKVERNVAYYVLAHGSKFVRPNAKRIKSSGADDASHVAFANPDGSQVIIVQNASNREQLYQIQSQSDSFRTTLPSHSLSTIVLPQLLK